MKICTKCSTKKSLEDFYIRKSSKDGFHTQCKKCLINKSSTYYEKNQKVLSIKRKIERPDKRGIRKQKHLEYLELNKEFLLQKKKIQNHNDYEKRKEYFKNYAKINSEKVKESLLKFSTSDKRKIYLKEFAAKNRHKINASLANRRANKLKATPLWANNFFIKEIYHLSNIRSKVTGFKWNVDHIVPLRSKFVCGLHCEANLQVIPAKANQIKSNLIWPDMPNNLKEF